MSILQLNRIELTTEITNNLIEIEKFSAIWNEKVKTIPASLLSSMRNTGAFESIGSSNRIEGNSMTNEEIEKFLSGLKTKSFRSRDEAEVSGYADALDLIYSNYDNIPLSENHIKQLHQILLKYSDKDERHRGEYKTLDNSVAAFDESGREIGIVFRTASAFETPILMHQLVKETNEALKNPILPKCLVIGLFNVHFLAIHPFQDGNGRISRLLTLLLMLKNGYTYIPYYSLEKLIEDSKTSYYRNLRNTQLSFNTGNADYRPWLTYFTNILVQQTRNLERKIEEYQNPETKLAGNEISVLTLIKELNGAGFTEIAENFPQMKANTLRRILRHLSDMNIIEKHGKGKGMWYKSRMK